MRWHEFAHANEVTEANVAKPKRVGYEVSPERRGGTASYPTFQTQLGIISHASKLKNSIRKTLSATNASLKHQQPSEPQDAL
ncbi:hypothetical protein CH363_09865 [Leptospira haakeii]|uniref:Uncharacterized protein n=1 Tax=Leptospira haakeii TaxID=2023198 RepID=A0ABX4PKV5_9LEPT|nr:hypothetical protein CH363_09865 [Leptospira haakeii]PKA18095.1 hypothetical protein CH377_19380 [Leptospira haakeii]